MTLIVDGTSGVTFNDSSLQGAAASPFGLKNRIINGDMVIDQRNAGASTTPTVSGTYNLDRWLCGLSQPSKFSIQQNQGSITPPAGFTNYIGVTSLSAYSTINTDQFWVGQYIEGLNVADLGWGTANAATVTLSFWARSSLTGSFSGALTNDGFNRSYPFSYTISSANTWTKISVTIPGDTTGTWLRTNGAGIRVIFSLGVGSSYQFTAGSWVGVAALGATGEVSLVGTNAATWQITGVQLERNTTATPFEWLPYTTELQLCQRYFYKTFGQSVAPANDTAYQSGIGVPGAIAFATGSLRNFTIFPQPMRTTPTVTYYNTNITTPRTNGVWIVYLAGGAGWTTATSMNNGEISDLYVEPNIDKSGSFTIGWSYLVSGFLTASAEL